MSGTKSRLPLLVIVALVIVVAAIGRILRDAALGLPLFSRISLPLLGIGLGLFVFVCVLRYITRRARLRIRRLKVSDPRSAFYSVAGTPELRESSRAVAGESVGEVDISSFPTLKVDAEGISLWGDDAATGNPARVWARPWDAVSGVSESDFNDYGVPHRAVSVQLVGTSEVPFVLCREDLGGFSVGRKARESFKALLRTHLAS